MLTDLITLSGSIGAVQRTADRATASVGTLARLTSGQAVLEALKPASLGGVPFAALAVRTGAGRRNAVHEYPKRDGAWVEDMGRQARAFEIQGFLVDSSVLYARRPIAEQRHMMLNAVENFQSMTLVHPTLGEVRNVNVLAFEMFDSVDLAGATEFRASLVQSIDRLYPQLTTATDAVAPQVAVLQQATLADYLDSLNSMLQAGAAVVQEGLNVSIGYGLLALNAVRDVKRFQGAVSTLDGAFGRFIGGGNKGFAASASTAIKSAPGQSVASTISADAQARQGVVDAVTALKATPATSGADFAAGAAALAAAVRGACTDPLDAIRLMAPLASFAPAVRGGQAPVGVALDAMATASSALMRRTALAQIAAAAHDYQPSSLDVAIRTRNAVAGLLEDEIVRAADLGDDESYQALRALRSAVIADLDARATGLPALRTWELKDTLPALALAHRLYQDSGRADELVALVNPASPVFMPTTFTALAA